MVKTRISLICPLDWITTDFEIPRGIFAYEFVEIIRHGPLVQDFLDDFGATELGTLRLHEYNIREATSLYAYFDSTVEDPRAIDELYDLAMNNFRGELINFTSALWLIKDHSFAARDVLGIIRAPNTTRIYTSSSIRAVHSSNGEPQTKITRNDLEVMHNGFLSLLRNYERNSTLKKRYGVERPLLLLRFLHSAREEALPHPRIAAYVTCLECLLTRDHSELRHRLAERVAFLLGPTYDERISLYRDIQRAYDVRSAYVHGQKLSMSGLEDLSSRCDSVLRKLLAVSPGAQFQFPELIDGTLNDESYAEFFFRKSFEGVAPTESSK